MDCYCRKYGTVMENTNSEIQKIRMKIEEAKLQLGAIEEAALKAKHPRPQNPSDHCSIQYENVIEAEKNLYLVQCELDAYNAKLNMRDPAFYAERRRQALAEYREKYYRDHPEQAEQIEVDENGVAYDEID